MKMKYIVMLATALFAFGAPVADAAPKKGKKAKTTKKAEEVAPADEFDIFSPTEAEAVEEARKAARKETEEYYAAEEERYKSLSGAERREENKLLIEETKIYIENQKQTLKILRTVRNEKTAAKAVKPMEKIYGEVVDTASSGSVTALGTVKIMEEDELKLPVHQSRRSIAAALNQAINKEIARIGKLNIQDKKFNGVMQNMIDSQR